MNSKTIKNLLLVVLAVFISVTVIFSIGEIAGGRKIEIRAEDILIAFLGIFFIAGFFISKIKRIKRPPLLVPILVWLSFGLFSTLSNWVFSDLSLSRGFFYSLKEMEFFFIYFFVFYSLKDLKSVKFILKAWIFLGAINVSWVIIQMLKGFKGTYGQEAIGEPYAPFPSGGFFLLLFIFFFNLFLYYFSKLKMSIFKKGALMLVCLGPALGVFSSGSRTSGLSLIIAIFLTMLLYFFKERNKATSFAFIALILILLVSVFLYFSPKDYAFGRSITLKGFSWEADYNNTYSRVGIWRGQILKALEKPEHIFFGYGKSALLLYEESHSQYVRNFVETGIFGSLAFFLLIFAIIKKALSVFLSETDIFTVAMASGLLIATVIMLVISIAAEAFMVVKIAETYWFFVGLTMAGIALKKND